MKNVLLTHHVPEVFIRLAAYYKLKPERLARLVCNEFAQKPPAKITIVTHVPKGTKIKWIDDEPVSEDDDEPLPPARG